MSLPKELHQAAEQGDTAEMLRLLDQQAPDVHRAFASSYLGELALEGQIEVIKYLHHQGMVLDARDEHGATILYYAAVGRNIALMQYLQEEGADINVKDESGSTLLHVAALRGDLALVKYLCEQGISVNVANNNGHTALYLSSLADMVRGRDDTLDTPGEDRKIIAYLQQQGGILEAFDQEEKQ